MHGWEATETDAKRAKHDALDTMWSFLQMGAYKLTPAEIGTMKDACEELRHMLTQKTAGQRKDKPGDADFRELDAVVNSIVVGAMILYLSGALDRLEETL